MTLAPGSRLGLYEITAKLGTGGMGEVWRATDSRLKREVAIKVLPEEFTQDAKRLARLEREAVVLASLNHPNIAAIYGLEESGGTRALVMELVAGPTLADRVASGRLNVSDSISIARQIAAALEEAHDKGIVHRDLKPQNVKTSHDGRVKVLDFGLARLASDSTFADGTTTTSGITMAGTLVGTVGYMAPEQVRAEPIDERCDLFALGCLLYEMLTGERAFSRDTPVETLHAILNEEPPRLMRPDSPIPPAVARVVQHCLEKQRAGRYRTAHDLGFDLDALLADSPSHAFPLARPRWRTALPWGLAALFGLVAGISIWSSRGQPPIPDLAVRRYVVPLMLPPAQADVGRPFGTAVALSPDGSDLAYVAEDAGSTRLDLLSLAQLTPKSIPGTRGATAPFFSPDGRWLGFFADRKLKKLDLVNGDVVTICPARFPWGGSWSGDEIFFTPGSAFGIWKVGAKGGVPSVVAVPQYDHGERLYRFPEVLPGGRAVLFSWVGTDANSAALSTRIALHDTTTGRTRILIQDGSNARYLSSGHIVYLRDRQMLAVPFDLQSLQVMGPAVPAGIDVLTDPGTTAAQFTLAADGTLAYVPGTTANSGRRLVWVNRKGEERPVNAALRFYSNLAISPDGRRLASGLSEGSNMDIWVDDLERGTSTRLTIDLAVDLIPVWTPDGERVTFGSTRGGPTDIYSMPAHGGEREQVLVARPLAQWPTAWSPDGKWLAYTESDPNTGFDIWMWSRDGTAKPFLKTAFDEGATTFSPDGKWVSYSSNESSRDEVYVRAFTGPGPKYQISTEGGTEPIWSHDGREIFYRNGTHMVAVAVTTSPSFHAAKPVILFSGNYQTGDQASYAVSPDRQRFLMIRAEPRKDPVPLHVVLHWSEELRRRLPGSTH